MGGLFVFRKGAGHGPAPRAGETTGEARHALRGCAPRRGGADRPPAHATPRVPHRPRAHDDLRRGVPQRGRRPPGGGRSVTAGALERETVDNLAARTYAIAPLT